MSADHGCFQNSSALKRWNLVRSRDAACPIACRASLPTKTLPTNHHLLPAVKVLGCQIWSASQRLVVSWETQAGRGGCGSSGVEVVGARCNGHLSEPALSPNVFLLFVQVTDWNVPIIFWVHIASVLGRGFTFVSVRKNTRQVHLGTSNQSKNPQSETCSLSRRNEQMPRNKQEMWWRQCEASEFV